MRSKDKLIRKFSVIFCYAIANILYGAEIIYETNLPPYPAPIFVPLNIGGNKLQNVILNLSSDGVILDKKHLSILGYQVGQEARSSMDGQMSLIPKHQILGEMKLGSQLIRLSEVGVSDLSQFYTFSGFHCDGRIGVEPLSECSIEFLYSEEKFRIRRGQMKDMAGFKQASVSLLQQRLPMVEFEINGVMEHFLIDSGGNTSISLSDKTFNRLVTEGKIKEENTSVIVGTEKGRSEEKSGKVVRLDLFGQRLDGMIVSSIKGSQSMLGTAFLIGFDSALDLPGKSFFYRAIKVSKPKVDVERMLGIRLVFYEGAVVGLAVQEGGTLAKAGFSRYDRLDRLGTLKTGDFNVLSLQEFCWKHQGREVEMEYFHHSEDRNVRAKLTMPSVIYSAGNPKW